MTRFTHWLRSRHGQFAVIAVVSAALTYELPASRIDNWLGAWHPTVGMTADGVILLGSWAILVGAIRGRGSRRNGLVPFVSAAARLALLVHTRELGRAAAPVLAGWVAAAATLLAATWANHPYGTPPLLQLATVPAAVLTYVAIGYAAGYWIPHPAAPLVLALLPYVATYVAIVHDARGLDHLIVDDQVTLDYYRKTYIFLAGQLIFFLALSALSISIAARHWLLAAAGAVVAFATALLLTAIPSAQAIVAATDRTRLTCQRDNELRICLTRAHANNYQRLDATFQPVLPLLLPRSPHGVTLVEIDPFTPPTGDDIAIDMRSSAVGSGARMDRNAMLIDLAPTILGYPPYRCSRFYELPGGRLGLNLAGEITQWYFTRYRINPDTGPHNLRPFPEAAASNGLAEHLLHAPDADVIAWLNSEAVQADLAACATTTNTTPP